jgi:hypothetical protein
VAQVGGEDHPGEEATPRDRREGGVVTAKQDFEPWNFYKDRIQGYLRSVSWIVDIVNLAHRRWTKEGYQQQGYVDCPSQADLGLKKGLKVIEVGREDIEKVPHTFVSFLSLYFLSTYPRKIPETRECSFSLRITTVSVSQIFRSSQTSHTSPRKYLFAGTESSRSLE